MATQLFLNLPVKDLPKSREFFTRLGFEFNDEFSDDNAASMVLSDDGYVMLLAEEFFKTHVKKEIADTGKTIEAIAALGVESRERVDDIVEKAVANGGVEPNEAKDEGFMYGRGFYDLDGHFWEVFHMDMSAIPG
jgi:uncharacterized protein